MSAPRRALLALAALVVLAAAMLAPARSPAAEPQATAIQFGFNEWPAASSYPLQKQVNAPVRRMFVGWHRIQAGGSGSWDWNLIDSQYLGIRAAGLTPLLVVVGAPCWAHPSAPCEGVDTMWRPPDAAYDGAWAEFNRRVASRYPDAAAIEIWNEANIKPAWAPYPDPARYTELLKSAYTAIKGAADIPVISTGLFAHPGTGWYGISDGEFLKAMYRAGAKGFMDGIGIHPYLYTTPTDGSPKVYDPAVIHAPLSRLRAVRDAAGDGSTPLWITETGESTTTQKGFPPAASEGQQANHLVSAVRAVRSMPDVRAMIVHKLVDRPPELGGPYAAIESGFGLHEADGTPKQAACALSRELGGSLQDCGPATVSVRKLGAGWVSSSPTAISCGSSCSTTLAHDAAVRLTATPASGHRFQGWSGCPEPKGRTCSTRRGIDTAVTAIFSAIRRPVPPGELGITAVKRNKRRGTALLVLSVPGPGRIALRGKDLKRAAPASAAAGVRVSAGEVKVKVQLVKGSRRQRLLQSRGKVKVRVRVSYAPAGGMPGTQAKKLTLVRR